MPPPGRYVGRESSTVIWAAGWDFALGDTPEEMDPGSVAGRVVDAVKEAAPQNSRTARAVFGNIVAFGLPLVGKTVAGWLIGSAGRVNRSLGREVAFTLFKGTLSIRSTLQATSDAVDLERMGDGGTTERDDDASGAERRASGVLDRMATDYTESVVGPLFYYGLMGVPGAVWYRVARVLRDRWAADDDRQDPLGPAASRAFAVANYLPSVLSGVLLSWSALWTEGRGSEAWRTAKEESRKRDWKNPRWTAGSMAGALDVRIREPVSEDAINPKGRPAGVDDLPRARKIFLVATGVALVATVIVSGLRLPNRAP